MPRFKGTVDIGDVLVTREGPWWVSGAIRLGALLRGRPTHVNHAIVIHHQDSAGTWWGIEGRPGGVGWRDLTGPLSWAATNANNRQVKTVQQRADIARLAESLLGTPYDWEGIAQDAADALGVFWSPQFAPEWSENGQRPYAVVCSSYADWIYERVGLANPGGVGHTRATTPGDWDLFMIREGWKS